MLKPWTDIPAYTSLPLQNPHAVSVNLPKMQDIISYEEGDAELLTSLQSAYPRFFMNLFVRKVCDDIRNKKMYSPDIELLPVGSTHAAQIIQKALRINVESATIDNFSYLLMKNDSTDYLPVKCFIQHTGLVASSRRAEEYLLNNSLQESRFAEQRTDSILAEKNIKSVLANAYGGNVDDVTLCNSGMNALYSVFESIKKTSKKKIFVRLGWLYMDTMQIIKKYSPESVDFVNVIDLHELDSFVAANHGDIAAIFTEAPTNPLIQTVDVIKLRQLTIRYSIPLVIDATVGTPFNMRILEYADIVVESLTKFACGNADVMMGAIIVNNDSSIVDEIRTVLPEIVEYPFIGDIERLAFEIEGYENRVKIISANTKALADYFYSNKKIETIYWVGDPYTKSNFDKIQKQSDAYPGTITITFNGPLVNFYDKLPLPKGPSFGTKFTLAMAYLYMAHYDLVKTSAGRRWLKSLQMDPELLRISVGMEPIEDIIRVFEEL